ncbi:transglutaminaseTgpA domain-containing protein [uncultured Jatrophihabitans sp.]|uniref:transglutaminase family protein n=1 Tax=uncultured Jatrophihabitans sp. TaxID=1610747 RepID=UPI0035C9AB4E
MTTTAPPRATRPEPATTNSTDRTALRRTLSALVACGLGAVPLKGLFVDSGWLVDAWLSMIIVIAPAALLRLRRAPGALDVWPGVILLVLWLTQRFAPLHALGGFIPTGGTVDDVNRLMTSLHATTRDGVAPIHTTVAVRLVVCALLGLLAALVDLIAVVGRRGALATVPLLVIFVVSGAVPRQPVAWMWFVVGAAGFLILLGLDATDEHDRWGRRIARGRDNDTRGDLASRVSAQQVGIVAIVLALAVPAIVPSQSRNLITDAFHHHHGHGGGSGTGGVSPFADLKGELNRRDPVNVADVTIEDRTTTAPFYLRSDVLDLYSGVGWRSSGHSTTTSIDSGDFSTSPDSGSGESETFRAHVKVDRLDGVPPVFAEPIALAGLDAKNTQWSSRDQILQGAHVQHGDSYTEEVSQPAVDRAALEQATAAPSAALRHWLQLPKLPAEVDVLVNRVTFGKSTPYDKARAINDYFTNPANGFQYSTRTKLGDSGNELVDFLRNKTGYCQQYAAAMGVMLRASGVPARVVLGYEHPAPDAHGSFTVTSLDAHAWVEAYFAGAGWIPFDPTPIGGLDGGPKTDLAYAPHPYTPQQDNGIDKSRAASPTASPAPTSSAPTPGAGAHSTTSAPVDLTPLWGGLIALAVLAVLLAPASVRFARRRRRYRAARAGDTEALWAELSDTATDLGYVWSSARSPRQVAHWLGDFAGRPAALDSLALAVERSRYGGQQAAQRSDARALTSDLESATGALRARRSGRSRLRATLLPPSLGFGRRGRRS